MIKIGLISDTHNFLHHRVKHHFKAVDEIWHAGDIGTTAITDELTSFKPLRAVYGNIDGTELRKEFPKHQFFELEGVKIWMTHIGGYPPKYKPQIINTLNQRPIDLFICGHSHILKAIPDHKRGLIHLNPGAAGKHGFHKTMTLMRFDLDQGKVKNLEVIELGPRAT